jgi:predicted  nucleic acid-binding Zn-ribbon protein
MALNDDRGADDDAGDVPQVALDERKGRIEYVRARWADCRGSLSLLHEREGRMKKNISGLNEQIAELEKKLQEAQVR